MTAAPAPTAWPTPAEARLAAARALLGAEFADYATHLLEAGAAAGCPIATRALPASRQAARHARTAPPLAAAHREEALRLLGPPPGEAAA